MVSYKRLTPEQEEVHFSGVPLLQSADDSPDGELKVEDAERPLVARRPHCSVTAALMTIGGFILVGLGIWLLGTVLWLRSDSSIGIHRPPPPAAATPGNSSLRQNRTEPRPCSGVPESWRFDCYPERGVVVTEDLCHARNCCFLRVEEKVGVPWCFYPPDFPSYSINTLNETQTGLSGKLVRTRRTYYPGDVDVLQLDVLFETDSRLRVKITDPAQQRFEVPVDVPLVGKRAAEPSYTVEFNNQPFGIVVKRKQNGAVLLNTTVAPLFYADQFVQISTALASAFVYGLGEHRSNLAHDVHWKTFTMWARDAAPDESINLYGVHPFYLLMETDGLAHGVFLLNSNAMDVVLQPAPALTWRTIGGILDLYVFVGPDPGAVVAQYLQVVGQPAMPVYWALGFHLCRWGYESSNKTWDVVKDMRNYGIPQEVQWNDIDYMDRALDFTFDPVNFSTLPELVKDLHLHSQRYVIILDPGISSTQPPGTYEPFEDGLKKGVFINSSSGGTLIGKVWPGLTAFPDFSNPDTHDWWYQNLQKLHSRVAFDGVWIDMNEPSSFLDGSVDGCPDDRLENPPYTPHVLGGSLKSKTVCVSALQRSSSHYNLHNLYGLMEAKATASALKRILAKRPFVISRSTFPSQGRYSGHWFGDNRSQWKDLYMSIPGMLTFNLLGVPLVGADICGFSQNTTEELCVRWTQLGAFYPFTRNHNTKEALPQDPTAFSAAARTAMKKALLLRYSLFPFLYTLFHHAHASGLTVARPLFFEFPADRKTYTIDKQFLWGRSLLVTPVLDPGVDYVVGYLPEGIWYDFYTGKSVVSKGEEIKFNAPLDKINLHLREGAVVPTQRPNTTLWVSTGQPFHLIVCVSADAQADGDLFWDDGESLDTYEKNNYGYITFSLKQNMLTSAVVRSHVEVTYLTLETVSFYGVKTEPVRVMVNSQEAEFNYTSNQVLRVDQLGLNLSQNFTINWM